MIGVEAMFKDGKSVIARSRATGWCKLVSTKTKKSKSGICTTVTWKPISKKEQPIKTGR